MVQPARPGSDSSADAGPASTRNRTGHRRTIPTLPVSMAASESAQPVARRGWHAANYQAIAGLRNLGGGQPDPRAEEGDVHAPLVRGAAAEAGPVDDELALPQGERAPVEQPARH